MAEALSISLDVVHIAQSLLICGDLDPGGPSGIPWQAGGIIGSKQPGLSHPRWCRRQTPLDGAAPEPLGQSRRSVLALSGPGGVKR